MPFPSFVLLKKSEYLPEFAHTFRKVSIITVIFSIISANFFLFSHFFSVLLRSNLKTIFL